MMRFEKYVGIPFEDRGHSKEAADCYGLVRLVYRQELGIEIPEFNSSCGDTRRIFMDYLKQISEHWDLVTEDFQPFDVIAMAYDPEHPKIVQHFGLYIGNGMMLQTLKGIGAFTIRVSEYQHYVKGIYRWRAST
jgi:cell wall-associated NlpC family hydrolase